MKTLECFAPDQFKRFCTLPYMQRNNFDRFNMSVREYLRL